MPVTACTLLLLSALSAFPAPPAGTQVTYQGTFESAKGEPAESRKSFSLTMFLVPSDVQESSTAGGTQVHWILDEQRFGGWPWTDRFGKFSLATAGQAEGHLPSLLYQRESGASIIGLHAPTMPLPAPPAAGQQWTEGRNELSVAEGGQRAGRATWRVRLVTPYGPKRSVWLDKQTGLLVALEENVTIGQGEPHLLRLEQTADPAGTTASDAELRALEQLHRLRDQLGVEPRTREVQWSGEQLAVLRAALPALAERVTSGAIGGLLAAAVQDAKDQKGRDGAVAVFQKNIDRQPLPQLSLKTITGQAFDSSSLKDQVTVLHFWDYRDTPLEEPYGQVGFLDFLYRKRQGDGVAVYGVAVNEGLADPNGRSAAVRSAKKFVEFMRLSYPVLVDGGECLKPLGDPRVAGAKLPLVIVVDRQGRVVHYHVGLYEVDQRRGLAALDDVVTQALQAK